MKKLIIYVGCMFALGVCNKLKDPIPMDEDGKKTQHGTPVVGAPSESNASTIEKGKTTVGSNSSDPSLTSEEGELKEITDSVTCYGCNPVELPSTNPVKDTVIVVVDSLIPINEHMTTFK